MLIVQFYLEAVSDAGRFVNVWVTVQVLGATKPGRDEPSNQQSYTGLWASCMCINSHIIFPLLLKSMTKAKYLINS